MHNQKSKLSICQRDLEGSFLDAKKTDCVRNITLLYVKCHTRFVVMEKFFELSSIQPQDKNSLATL